MGERDNRLTEKKKTDKETKRDTNRDRTVTGTERALVEQEGSSKTWGVTE